MRGGGRSERAEIARLVGATPPSETRRGRGATANPTGRFEPAQREHFDDGWDPEAEPPPLRTEIMVERARSIITRNDSPDIGFDRSINPYRGCEHGCVYCFARPNHAYQGLSPGLDFETKLFVKPNAPELLAKELSARGYEPRTIALGTATDPYQPIERRHRITRGILEVLARFGHPVGIVTKSALVTRDLDVLAPMAKRDLAKVAVSVTTLDPALARRMEPRAPSPRLRIEAIRALAGAGIPTMVLFAPVIPGLNDHELESVLERAREAGATEAGIVFLRLPHELKDLVRDWLAEHYPGRLRRVLGLVEDARGGKAYDATFGTRLRGEGVFADLVQRRFEAAQDRLDYARPRRRLRTDLFAPPGRTARQLDLF